MKVRSRAAHAWIVLVGLLIHYGVLAAADTLAASQAASATTLNFGSNVYLHRWSKGAQHEFTPEGDEDLSRWRDMVTLNTHDAVRNGEQLAALANSVLSNYQRHGKIVRMDSKPRTPQRPAEHLIVAILGNSELLEAVFARIVLVDGLGEAAVYSHRIYGKEAARLMGEWLNATARPSSRRDGLGQNSNTGSFELVATKQMTRMQVAARGGPSHVLRTELN